MGDRDLDVWLTINLLGYRWFTYPAKAMVSGKATRRLQPPGFNPSQWQEWCRPSAEAPWEAEDTDNVPALSSTWQGMGLILEAMKARGFRVCIDHAGDCGDPSPGCWSSSHVAFMRESHDHIATGSGFGRGGHSYEKDLRWGVALAARGALEIKA